MNEDGRHVPNRLAALTLGAWSALLLYFDFSGRLQAFLAPGFRPYVLWAGLVLAVMAIVLIFAGGELHACTDDSCGHAIRPGKQWTCFVLLMPVLLAVIAGDADTFSAQMVANRGEATHIGELGARPRSAPQRSRDGDLFPLPTRDGALPPQPEDDEASPQDWLPRTAEGYLKLEVLDLLFATQDAMMRSDFEGKTVALTGQCLPLKSGGRQNQKGHRFKCVRLFMACCAADARPVSVLIESDPLPAFPEMTWIEIVGEATFPLEGGKRVPVLHARRITPCPRPRESFLF